MSIGRVVTTAGRIVKANGQQVADTSCDGCGCATYLQSRLCSDGTLSGLWLAVADMAPFFEDPDNSGVKQDGVCYYFNDTDSASDTPGTLHSSYIWTQGCGDELNCTCFNCYPEIKYDHNWIVTISGSSYTAGCKFFPDGLGGFTSQRITSLDINASFCLAPNTADDGICSWVLTEPLAGISFDQFTSNGLCAGYPFCHSDYIRIILTYTGTGFNLFVGVTNAAGDTACSFEIANYYFPGECITSGTASGTAEDLMDSAGSATITYDGC